MKRVFSRVLGVLFVLFYVVACVSEPVIERPSVVDVQGI